MLQTKYSNEDDEDVRIHVQDQHTPKTPTTAYMKFLERKQLRKNGNKQIEEKNDGLKADQQFEKQFIETIRNIQRIKDTPEVVVMEDDCKSMSNERGIVSRSFSRSQSFCRITKNSPYGNQSNDLALADGSSNNAVTQKSQIEENSNVK